MKSLLTWSEEGFTWEGDPNHWQQVVYMLGLDGPATKVSSVPGRKTALSEDDAELSFAKGESLTVLPVVPPEGWLVAKRDDGAQGLVPAITWSTTD